MDYSDPRVISLLRENDPNAWEHFYADSCERLRRKAFDICGAATPEADIEDIVQDTFKRMFQLGNPPNPFHSHDLRRFPGLACSH